MENEFTPYELAVKLKALGFDEPCFGWYEAAQEYYPNLGYCKNTEKWLMGNNCAAPTWQSAFRWIREKKLSDGSVSRHGEADGGYSYRWDIVYEYGVYEERHFQKGYKTYEEAELACLEKLIEIVKSKLE